MSYFSNNWGQPFQEQTPPQVMQSRVPVSEFVQVSGPSWGMGVMPQQTDKLSTSPKKQDQGNLYKTELCRSYEETGICRYGAKCQFAHGKAELRPVARHPKYKTEICNTFYSTGACPYGKRCRFIHSSDPAAPFTPALQHANPQQTPTSDYTNNWGMGSPFSFTESKPEPFTVKPTGVPALSSEELNATQDSFQLITPSLAPLDFGNTNRLSFFESIGRSGF
mmetsp:Transcript_37584/g.81124  ORF Transcript_37584/g.81124 Transcript_37584/m.81124 type:complete len:222 (+) Transcript_37584:30-695(+)